MTLRHIFTLHLLWIIIMSTSTAAHASEPNDIKLPENDARAKAFIEEHVAVAMPLEQEVARCSWAANISGKDEDFAKKGEAERKLNALLSNPEAFARLKAIRAATIADPLLARQIQVLYLQYLPKQIDPDLLAQMTALANSVEQRFNTYRSKVGERELTDNQVLEILEKSTDSAERRATWEASKARGRLMEGDFRKLVKLRNDGARKLGFKDYHVMALAAAEQDQSQIIKLFDDLDALTRGPYHEVKAEIDAALAKQSGVKVEELMPWHYHDPFFQESPDIYANDCENIYRQIDIEKLCRKFYEGIGLPIDDVLVRSDLYEKPGKCPHAFCTDIDRTFPGDTRVLCNIVPGSNWLSTTVHELGHATYTSRNMPPQLPYVLRDACHPLTTEGIAEMMERFVVSAEWLQALGVEVPNAKAFDEVQAKIRRNRLLIFSRWCQVMFRFEKEMYADPDQDLNKLWWDLVEKYQGLKRPAGRNEPDYASKIHIVTVPVYYHNYLMGELFAAQVHYKIARDVLKSSDPHTAIYVGNRAAGAFLRDKIYAPGMSQSWNDLTRSATGEELSPKAFAAEIRAK
jgi:peptidyl-dipeptidase A